MGGYFSQVLLANKPALGTGTRRIRGIDLLSRRDPATATALERWLKETRDSFGGRILDVNLETALRWGILSSIRPQPQVDGLLAATAFVHDLTLVTRNTDDFRGLGLRVFNPFTGAAPTGASKTGSIQKRQTFSRL